MKKALWTLNLGNSYAPEICYLTYPLMKRYCLKIQADFNVITEDKFPSWPNRYNKVQIWELGTDYDYNIFFDSDALIHPDLFDVTDHLPMDYVMHNANDMAGNRFRYDRFFRRDGRNLGSCTWFAAATSWTHELWKPLDDMTLLEAVENIFPVISELRSGVIDRGHLIDDYTLSRNIAKYGLKFQTLMQVQARISPGGNYLWHIYTDPIPVKIEKMQQCLRDWGIGHKMELPKNWRERLDEEEAKGIELNP